MTDAVPRGWYVAFDTEGKAVPAGRGEAFGGWWWLPSAPSHENIETLPPGWTLGPRLDDLLSRGQQGHNKPCHHCGKPCNSLAGNPALWPTMVPAEQSARPMHMGCVADLLRDAARFRYVCEQLSPEDFATIDGEDLPAFIDEQIAREKRCADG